MGDRCFMRIRIGGVITQKGIDALIEANYSVTLNLEDIETAIANNCHLEVEEDEVNWGNVDDIKAACFDHKLAFHIYNGDGGSYGSGVEYWKPGMPNAVIREVTFEGDEALTYGEFKDITKKETSKAKKFDAVLRWFNTEFEMPPLTRAPVKNAPANDDAKTSSG